MPSKEWRRKQKALGLCIDCNQKAITGRVRCASCLWKMTIWHTTYEKKNREHRVANQRERKQGFMRDGRCYNCGAPLMGMEELKYCANCSMGSALGRIGGVLKYETAN